MKKLSKTLLMSPAVSLVLPAALFVSFNSAYASLVDTSQNQTFESRPQAAAISKRPVSSPFIKLAAVHFIANDGNLSFGNQEFLPEDICKQGGYTHKGCPAGYVKGEACPEDGSYVKDCIDPDTWCKNNGYEVTGCQVPQYPQGACPYGSGYYKSCETDNIRACKELGYSLTCEAGKVGDTNQSCPYNESYKKCVCNPCGGYGYTASEANAQGYTPGEVCNSCGTMKYKRSANACDGFKECTDGGAAGAEVCYSGSLKKFSECKEVCDPKFQYDSSNCTGDKVLTGNSCGGKFESCTSPCGSEFNYAKSDNYLAYGEECDGKKEHMWDYSFEDYIFSEIACKSNLTNCQSKSTNFSYADKNINITFKYYEPTAAQKNSEEVVVTDCTGFYKALNNPDIFNIKVSGQLTCTKQGDYMTTYVTASDKHIYGSSKNSAKLTFTETAQSYITGTNLVLSDITIDVSNGKGSPLFNSHNSFTVLNNVDIYVNSAFHESLYLKSGQNNFHISKGAYVERPFGYMVIDEDASLAVDNSSDKQYQTLSYIAMIVLGDINNPFNSSERGISAQELYIQGNNKRFDYWLTLNKGKYIKIWNYHSVDGIYIVGNNSEADSDGGSNVSVAVGDNSIMNIRSGVNSIAMGKNAKLTGYSSSISPANYSGEYTYYTTKDYSVFR